MGIGIGIGIGRLQTGNGTRSALAKLRMMVGWVGWWLI